MDDQLAKTVEMYLGLKTFSNMSSAKGVNFYFGQNFLLPKIFSSFSVEGKSWLRMDFGNRDKEEGNILHSRVMQIDPGVVVPMRNHHDVYQEIVMNIGTSPIEINYRNNDERKNRVLHPLIPTFSIPRFSYREWDSSKSNKCFHGFTNLSKSDVGLVYVLKHLKPERDGLQEFVDSEHAHEVLD